MAAPGLPGLLAPFALPHETEIAVARPFHDGLRALQVEPGTETLHHREIAVAVEQVPQLGQTELFVELGVLATRDVEVQPILGLCDRLDAKTAAGGPDSRNPFHARQVVAKLLCPSCSVLPGELDDDLSRDLIRSLLPDGALERLNHGNKHSCLDLAALEMREALLRHDIPPGYE